MQALRTERLDLVAAGLPQLEAELESTAALGQLLGAQIPEGWPPGEYDRAAIEFFQSQLLRNPQALGWYAWYAVLRDTPEQGAVLAGASGFFGSPGADGVVEIGYSIVPRFRRRGLATEVVDVLTEFALGSPGVNRVAAQTTTDNIGSIAVLERCGFRRMGPGEEPGTICYVLGSGGSGRVPWRGVRTQAIQR